MSRSMYYSYGGVSIERSDLLRGYAIMSETREVPDYEVPLQNAYCVSIQLRNVTSRGTTVENDDTL